MGKKKHDVVAVIGAGSVGATTIYALINAGAASRIILIDRNRDRARGEIMDLTHGASFVAPVEIDEGDYADCAAAAVVVVTAGIRQRSGEKRLDLVKGNLEVVRDVVPRISQANPDCIILMVTNPVDILTYASLKISGFPPERVMGSGTLLDTARFRYLLGRHCHIAVRNVHAYIIGEHGDSEVAAWSASTVAGMDFELFCKGCPCGCTQVDKSQLFEAVKNSAYEIIEKKGSTFYAIGLAVRQIVRAILRDESTILPVSTLMQGEYGARDVCLSLPSVVDAAGVSRVLELPLAETERQAFVKSAAAMRAILVEFGY